MADQRLQQHAAKPSQGQLNLQIRDIVCDVPLPAQCTLDVEAWLGQRQVASMTACPLLPRPLPHITTPLQCELHEFVDSMRSQSVILNIRDAVKGTTIGHVTLPAPDCTIQGDRASLPLTQLPILSPDSDRCLGKLQLEAEALCSDTLASCATTHRPGKQSSPQLPADHFEVDLDAKLEEMELATSSMQPGPHVEFCAAVHAAAERCARCHRSACRHVFNVRHISWLRAMGCARHCLVLAMHAPAYAYITSILHAVANGRSRRSFASLT